MVSPSTNTGLDRFAGRNLFATSFGQIHLALTLYSPYTSFHQYHGLSCIFSGEHLRDENTKKPS